MAGLIGNIAISVQLELELGLSLAANTICMGYIEINLVLILGFTSFDKVKNRNVVFLFCTIR